MLWSGFDSPAAPLRLCSRGAELPRINAQNLLIIPDCCKSLFSRSSITILSSNELPRLPAGSAALSRAHPCPRPLPCPPPPAPHASGCSTPWGVPSPPHFVQIIAPSLALSPPKVWGPQNVPSGPHATCQGWQPTPLTPACRWGSRGCPLHPQDTPPKQGTPTGGPQPPFWGLNGCIPGQHPWVLASEGREVTWPSGQGPG